MFRIENIEFLYLLFLVPAILVIFYLVWKWKLHQRKKLADPALMQRLAPLASRSMTWLKTVLFALSIGGIAIALANPQFGGRKEKVTAKSSDIFIAMDISLSMLAEDINPSRLERAKRFCTRLIRSLRGERIGLILFAGNAYLQMPLTGDYAASELFVNAATTDQAGTQGTSFANAIQLARDAFEPGTVHQRALIIISDGEDHEEDGLSQAAEASGEGIVIFTVAVGTEEGSFIPVINRGREEFKLDENGEPVRSKVNFSFMADIAEASSGHFYIIEQEREVINDIKEQIARLQKKEVEQRSFTDFTSYYQYFLIVSVLLLLLEYLLPSRKLHKLKTS